MYAPGLVWGGGRGVGSSEGGNSCPPLQREVREGTEQLPEGMGAESSEGGNSCPWGGEGGG